MTPPVVLTIAGSDSGGGAGIQADLKTFHAFGVFGTSAITAITAQNTLGVTAIHPVPPAVVKAQITAVMTDLHPRACKSGMLATSELVAVVAQAIAEMGPPHYVLDPVMVASSGDRLLAEDAERSIVDELLPLATLVTPNLDEAEILVDFEVREPAAMRRAAERLVGMGASAAIVKGGHLEGDVIVDILFDGSRWHEWRRPKVSTTSTHGTGCTLSAAIAAGLAQNRSLEVAVVDALGYLQRAISTAPAIGAGHGPLNHFAPAPSSV